jgi:hypothetical protein
MSLKLEEKNQIVFSCESLMEDDLVVVDELVLLVFNIKKMFVVSSFHFQ